MMDAKTDPAQVYTEEDIFENIAHICQCIDTSHHAKYEGTKTVCCFNATSGPEALNGTTDERTCTFVLSQNDYELVLPEDPSSAAPYYQPTGVRHEAFHFEVSVQEIARYFEESQLAPGAAEHVDFTKSRQVGLALLVENCGLAIIGHSEAVLPKVVAQLLLDVHAACVNAGHGHYTLVAACSEYTETPLHRLDFVKVTDLHNSCVYTRADTGGYLKTYFYEEPTSLNGVFTETGWTARIDNSSDSGSALAATDSSDSVSSCTSTLSADSDIVIDLAGLSTLPTPARTASNDSSSLRLPLNDRVGKWVASQPTASFPPIVPVGASPQSSVPPPSPGPPPQELQLRAAVSPRPSVPPPAAADSQHETICQGAGEAKTRRALLHRTDPGSAPFARPQKAIQAATGAAAATVPELASAPGTQVGIPGNSTEKKAIQDTGSIAVVLKRTLSPSSAPAPTPAQRPRQQLVRTHTVKQRCLQRGAAAAAAAAPTAADPASWGAIEIKQEPEPKQKWAQRGTLTDQKVDETNGRYVQRQLLLPTNKSQQILHVADVTQRWRDATATEIAIVPGVPAHLQDEVARLKDIATSTINFGLANIAQAVEVQTTNAAVQHSHCGKARPLQCKKSHRRARVGLLGDAGTEFADIKNLEAQLVLLANGILYVKVQNNDALQPWVDKHQQVARLIQELRARRATEL